MADKFLDNLEKLRDLKTKLEVSHTIALTETGKHLAGIYHELTFYERERQALSQIRATLVVNFVHKSTDNIQIKLTDELMMQVLQQYSQQLKQTTPVKEAPQ
jgi:flagellar biosynthesis chaperone FliJ